MGRSAPPRTWGLLFWLSLAAVVGAIETKNSGGGLPSPPAHSRSTRGFGLGDRFVLCRGKTEEHRPPPALSPPLLIPAATGGLSIRSSPCCRVSGSLLPRQSHGLWPPVPRVPGHSRTHSLAASAVPRAHGRSWKKGRQRSQSVPVVLCWHRQTSRPAASGPHSLACPLHLHLGEHGDWGPETGEGTVRGGAHPQVAPDPAAQ